MRLSILILVFASVCFKCRSKNADKLDTVIINEPVSDVEQMFSQADSVYIVRHRQTSGISMVDKKNGKSIPFPPLLVDGKPNYSIWQRSIVLKDSLLNRLTKILSRPYKDTSNVIETCKCVFVGTHSIFVIKGSKTAYLNFGFMSTKLEASKNFPLEEFDGQRWQELYDFSKDQGLIDEMKTRR